jgi:putative hydrolase of the HAD superfamily
VSLATERRAARERALGLLYEAESKGVDGAAVLAELPVPADPFAEALVRAVDEHRAQIDGLLDRFAEGWTVARMAALDRAALRMGSAELLTRPDVPTGVVLAETVDLAARFGTDGSGRFVNGLLARIAAELRPQDREPGGVGGADDPQTPPGSRSGASGEDLAVEGDGGEVLVDGVIVDLDGVIRHWDPEHQGRVEAELGLPAGALAAAAFEPDRLERAMDGRLAFADWCAEIGSEVAGAHGVEAALVAQAWSDSGWSIDVTVLELLAAVRRQVPVALLSNASTNLLEDLERSGIAGEFDAVVGSADIGAPKPSPAAFRAAAAAIGVPLERCLFVDDTPGHVEAARALGVRAAVFEDVADLVHALAEVGLP